MRTARRACHPTFPAGLSLLVSTSCSGRDPHWSARPPGRCFCGRRRNGSRQGRGPGAIAGSIPAGRFGSQKALDARVGASSLSPGRLSRKSALNPSRWANKRGSSATSCSQRQCGWSDGLVFGRGQQRFSSGRMACRRSTACPTQLKIAHWANPGGACPQTSREDPLNPPQAAAGQMANNRQYQRQTCGSSDCSAEIEGFRWWVHTPHKLVQLQPAPLCHQL